MEKPPYYRVRLSEIDATVNSLQVGSTEVIARSPLGHPVYAVAFGPAVDASGTTNLSGANGANSAESYKREAGQPQTVVLVGGCHGAEAEGVNGCINMIQVLETGQDYKGVDRSALKALADHYRVVIVPCLNPDGRERSPDHLIGVPSDELIKINQGTWKDGSPVGYPECKKYQPLPPEEVAFLGGYPNSEGYNIMHDADPGDIRCEETRGLLRLVSREKADLVLHLHTHAMGSELLTACHGMPDLHRQRIMAYRQRMAESFRAKGLTVSDRIRKDDQNAARWLGPLNLTTLTALSSGALSPTFEQPNGAGELAVDFETIHEESLAVFELFMQWGLKEPFSPRRELFRSMLDTQSTLYTY